MASVHVQGLPCGRCGGTLRYRRNRECVPCARERIFRRTQDPEVQARQRERMARYYEKSQEMMRAKARARYDQLSNAERLARRVQINQAYRQRRLTEAERQLKEASVGPLP